MQRQAKVIKGGSATMQPLERRRSEPRRATIVRRERLEALEQAKAILAEARAASEKLRADAQREAEQLRAEAEQRGYEAGMARALADAVRFAIKEEQLDHRQLERSVQMARLIAERLMGRQLETDPAAVADMACAALAEVRGARQVRFVAHPDDVQVIRQALPADALSPMLVEVVAGEHLARGDFELRTDAGRLDASLGPRLTALVRALAENLS